MAVILYPSGVTETYIPEKLVFADSEILKIFNEFTQIRTARLYEVPNTWCVWANNEEDDESIFNKLGSDIVQQNIFSEIMFIHDTELDPAWMLTDDIILNGYEDFRIDLLQFFDDIAENVIKESERIREEQGNNLIFLTTIGPSPDKRVFLEFDPHKQSTEFWQRMHFSAFCNKVHEFLSKFYKDGDMFVLFADKKSIILVKDENVDFIMDKIIYEFENYAERYEQCNDLNKVYKSWKKFKRAQKKRDENERK